MSKSKIQLLSVTELGVERVVRKEGQPIELFNSIKDATAFTKEHPDLFPYGRATYKNIIEVQQVEATG